MPRFVGSNPIPIAIKCKNGRVAQLADATDLSSVLCGFDSHLAYQKEFGVVAEWLKATGCKPVVNRVAS